MFPSKHSLLRGLGFISLLQHTYAQNWDGPSPYLNGTAPDVTVKHEWNSSYPSFEGSTSKYPELVKGTDGGNNSEAVPSSNDTSSHLLLPDGIAEYNSSEALPTSNLTSNLPPLMDDLDGFNSSETSPGLETRADKDFYLRIMPLGASIVQGVQSSDGNGFRKLLRQQLRWKGWDVNMVGTKNDGDMTDNDNQGHPGWRIDEIHGEWNKSEVHGLKPNVVLINGGTNDCGQDKDTANAGVRMKDLIDDIYDKLPEVTVILSTLVKSKDHSECANALSRQFRYLVTDVYSGKRIGLADIDANIEMEQLDSDGIHPNDDGYKLFAAVWWDAISKLEDKIQPPPKDGLIKDDSESNSNKCKKVAGNASGPLQSQKGSGHDDGKYAHDSSDKGSIEPLRVQKEPARWNRAPAGAMPLDIYFADIAKIDPDSDRSRSLDEFIRVEHDFQGKIKYSFRHNLGEGKFGDLRDFDPDMDCPYKGPYQTHTAAIVAFGDFNNDGLDDFFCIKEGASVSVSLNRGGFPPRFESIGEVVPATSGWKPKDVVIGDIDGDGRADFCLVDDQLVVKCSRNAGQGDKHTWQGFSTMNGLRGEVFDGTKNRKGQIRLGDINGDYRSDILLVDPKGKVDTWTNSRGRGSGIVPDWVSAGTTHPGQSKSITWADNIKFGRIYGSNRLDYIYYKEEKEHFEALVWENKGSGGTKLKADGNFYCDMRGTGIDDYVWIYADGHSNEIFVNTNEPPYWDPDHSISINVGTSRTLIHLADWTGNGRCDVLVQDKTTSDVTLWENQWNEDKKELTFEDRGVVATPGCGKSTGVGIFDRNMRIADMDGDGRADVVCFELDGKLTSWLNKKDGMEDVGQIKKSEGWDRANLRLVDVENSGRADVVWLNKYTGAGSVFTNKGYEGPNGGGGGSSFAWTVRGVLFAPIDRGEVMNFANMAGSGRADLVQVYPTTNEAYTFYNKCPGGGGGDDGDVADPKLPTVSGGDSTDRDDYYEGDEDEKEGVPPNLNEHRNLFGTVLAGFYGCETADESNAIVQAYADARILVDQPQFRMLDFKDDIAKDFFGDYDQVTKKQRTQIQSVLTSMRGVRPGFIPQSWQWQIFVRCKERTGVEKCKKEEPEDPCENPEDGDQKKDYTLAYTANQRNPYKKLMYNGAEITFCPQFFEKKTLKDAMAYGYRLGDNRHLYLDNYKSQASIFLHELFHVDLAANSLNGSPNPHITDLSHRYTNLLGETKTMTYYGSQLARTLAMYDNSVVFGDFYNGPGFYAQRNADNFALFCLSWYVKNKLTFYPNMPRPGGRPVSAPGVMRENGWNVFYQVRKARRQSSSQQKDKRENSWEQDICQAPTRLD